MKKLLATFLALVLVVGATALSVGAADANSNATVEFEDGGIEVIDPDTDPDPDPENIYSGLKSINLDFGIRKIKSTTQIYDAIEAGSQGGNAAAAGTKKPMGLILSDARGLEGAKWDVKSSITRFEATGVETLKGFSIALDPVAGSLAGPSTITTQPTQKAIILKAGEAAASIFESDAAGSPGKWGGNWDAQLTVPGGSAIAATSTSTITWSIVATIPTP